MAAAALRSAPPPTKRSVQQRLEPEADSLQEASVEDPATVEEEVCDEPDPLFIKDMQQEMDESGAR